MDDNDPGQVLTSTCYDGRLVQTVPGENYKTPARQARLHRWTVRAYLYSNGLNKLPAASDWKED